MILFMALLAACALMDPDDCRLADPSRCAVYLPAGMLCGLAHGRLDGHPGSTCGGVDPAEASSAEATGCPEGFSAASLSDHDADANWHTCTAVGNEASSSAVLAEVPVGAACGLNGTGPGRHDNTCMGAVSSRGECPAGFTLAYTLDIYADAPTPGEAPVLAAHLVTWCELGSAGCRGDACPETADLVCGLSGAGFLRSTDAEWVRSLVPMDELTDGMRAALEADLADGSLRSGTCQGEAPGECPEGLERTCTGEWLGSEGYVDEEALCWCTSPAAVVPR